MTIIYLLECKNDDSVLYKIGSTKNVENRIKKLQTGNPYEIKEIAKFESSHGQLVERALHNGFGYCRKKGEWFQIELKDVVNFINICEKIEKGFDALKDNTYFNKHYL